MNNWTEHAFLVFDTIFLDNHRNKRYVTSLYRYLYNSLQFHCRIDRLAAIIVNEFFPFYLHWSNSPKQQSKELTEINYAAHKIWDMGEVEHVGGNEYRVLETL